jgi:flagellar basal-body rod protein FlgB
MLENIALFNGMIQKMDYLQVRQRVLSQNITNNDTPGYQAHDVSKPDFSKTMANYMGRVSPAKTEHLGLSTTSNNHIDINGRSRPTAGRSNRDVYDITPSGNSVSMEEQMMSASQNAGEYQLVTNLYNKNLDILRSALRR